MALRNASDTSDCSLYAGYDAPSGRFVVLIGRANAAPDWATYASGIPATLKRAQEIWRDIKEREACTFYMHEMYVSKVIVGSRGMVWSALDDRLLPHKRDQFKKITAMEAKQLTGDEDVWRAMLDELRLVGVTCRVV